MRKEVLTGSGKWLLDKKEYIKWRSSAASSVLWLYGIPGSGKSNLIACVIESLAVDTRYSTTATAYFYCQRDGAEGKCSKPQEVIRSLVRQLAFQSPSSTLLRDATAMKYEEKVRESKKRHAEELDDLSWEECVHLLVALLTESPTVLVIDALDELEQDERWILYQALQTIFEGLKGDNIKLLVSSRDDGDIVMELSKYTNVYIDATDNAQDIQRYTTTEVRKAIQHKRLLSGRVIPKLEHQITATLIDGAGGM